MKETSTDDLHPTDSLDRAGQFPEAAYTPDRGRPTSRTALAHDHDAGSYWLFLPRADAAAA